ncbi:hypothetical protein ASG01_14310 [Chryseobacterium sp. Leaf180]|uniref:TonB-dependent receptor plug domain-containing protein n=1 Tax=Chryseobacterium sp. Leaf180 TaxID=1736289 RepID=UPI0006F95A4B|nr:outer membrane beta-barrel protein [Chryseobacterium sp. Leaf180]KQR91059.1 hypothetical protein ASG01_14310 [Chryseobacterium sp. Leaf180]
MKKFLGLAGVLCITLIFSQQSKTDSATQTKDIEEVILKSQKKKQYSDKSVYTFDKEAIEKARYAKDLIKSLPELQLDPVSNTIRSTKGGTTLFLINGIESTDMQVRSVQPSEVVRVEYFDVPPARWATRADQVVNLVTRNPETGYVFGSDTSAAFTTGFVNASAYGNYTRGKNDFGVEYSLEYRDYDNRQVSSTYDYRLDSSRYRSEEQRRDHFGYAFQNISLRYTHAVADRYAFQAKVNVNVFSSFYKGLGSSIFKINDISENHTLFKNGNSEYAKPTVDLYYSKNIGKNDELTVNLVASQFKTNTSELAQERIITSGALVYNNDLNLQAKQTGMVGEIAHIHNFKKGRLSSGYRISNTGISNDLINLEGYSQYTVNYLEQYLYTEYSGKINKLMYRLGAGMTNIHNKSAENIENEWVFSPKVILSYAVKNNQNLRFTGSYKPINPGSAALSSNVTQIAPNIVQRGNPYLTTAKQLSNNLIYSFNNKHFDFNANAFYTYTDGAFNQYYILDNTLGGYALTYENAGNSQRYGLQVSGSYKPLGNSLLVIKAALTPTSENLRTKSGTHIKNNYIENEFTLTSEYKSFSVQYQFNIPVYKLDGAFLRTNENANHAFVGYKLKEWTFTTGMYWIGMPAEYRNKSLPESLVNYTSDRRILNNKSMLVLGVSYDFSKGKKTQIEKKLNNNTSPAATF